MLPTTVPDDIDKYFFGRKKDIENVEKYIDALRQDLPNQIEILGRKGVGKTILVKKILKDTDKDILTIYLDLSNIYGYYQEITEEHILKELLNKINNVLTEDTKLGKIKSHLNSFVQSFLYREYIDESVDIFNISIPKFHENYSKLSRLVMELLQNIVDSSDDINGIIIAFDEIEMIKYINNPNAFLYLIRSCLKNQKNILYIFTGNINDEIRDIIHSADFTFGVRIPHVRLDPFNLAETTDYLKQKAPHLKFSEDGFEMFHYCSLGIPSYINYLANSLDFGEIYDSKKVLESYFKLEQIEIMWSNKWNDLSNDSKEIIKILMEYDQMTFDEIHEKCDLKEDEIKKSIELLIRKHLILFNLEENYYLLNINMLINWLNYKKQTTGFYPL